MPFESIMAKNKKATPIILIDLQKELLLQVDGEDQKNHTLSWDILRKIGDNTQNLIYKLAKFSLGENVVPPESLKLEFTEFLPGSAVPVLRLPKEQNLLFNADKFYKDLNTDFSFVLGCINDGNFKKIAEKYNTPLVKNQIVEAVYEFTNSAGTTPLRVVKKITGQKTLKFKSLAIVRPMSSKIKGALHVQDNTIAVNTQDAQQVEAVGTVLLKTSANGKKTKKVTQLYTNKEATLSLKFDSVETDKRIYVFANDLYFSFSESKKWFVIENTALDIYASGTTMEEAEKDLFEQFDYTFQRLTKIADNKLSKHLLSAKKHIQLIVDKVKEK